MILHFSFWPHFCLCKGTETVSLLNTWNKNSYTRSSFPTRSDLKRYKFFKIFWGIYRDIAIPGCKNYRNDPGGMKVPIEMPSAINLEDAFFCLNCEAVTNCSDICPGCGHGHLWPLEKWLGKINGHQDSQYERIFLQEVGPARNAKISKRSSRRNYQQTLVNCTSKFLGVIFTRF